MTQTAIDNADHAAASDTPRQAGMFAALLAGHFVVDCYGGIWPIFKKLAGIDLGVAGFISTATILVAALQPFIGLYADKGRRRALILIGVALSMLGMTLGPVGIHQASLGAGVTFALLLGIMLAVRMGQAMFHPAATSVAGSLHLGKRSTFLSIFIAAGMLGFASSQRLFAYVYEATGGQTHLLLIPAAVVLALMVMLCRPRELHADHRPKARDIMAELWRLRAGLLPLYLIMVMVAALAMGAHFLLPEFVEYRGYPGWLVDGGAAGLIIAGSVITMVPVGHIAERVGLRGTLTVTLALAAVGYFALILLPPMPVPLFGLLCLVVGGAMGTANPLGVSLAQHLMPRMASTVSGVMMGLAWAVGGMAPSIVGMLAKIESIGYVGALLALGATAIIAVLLMAAVPRHDVA